MVSYYVCPICREPIETERYREHFAAHGEVESKINSTSLKQILDDAKETCKEKDKNPISLFFEIARRIFSEAEGVDTTSWDFVFEIDIPNIMADVQLRVPSPYPPVMCHIQFRVKDKQKSDELLKKLRGTEEVTLLKDMVPTNMPVVVVYGKEWGRLCMQWKSEGKLSSDILMLTVFFFLHEMYHIVEFGEKESTTKASIVMYQFFGQDIGIPEHETERWRYEEKKKKQDDK